MASLECTGVCILLPLLYSRIGNERELITLCGLLVNWIHLGSWSFGYFPESFRLE